MFLLLNIFEEYITIQRFLVNKIKTNIYKNIQKVKYFK